MTGLVFLWWQCVLVASTWYKKTDASNLATNIVVKEMRGGFIRDYLNLDTADCSFLEEIARDRTTVDATTIEKTMNILSKIFEAPESTQDII